MDDGSITNNDTTDRDALLYFNGHAYRLLFWEFARGGCYQALKLGTRENYRALFEDIARDPAMRHRLWLEALYWGAYFGEFGAGHDFLTWLTEQTFTGRLGLYHVVCTAPHRGEPKKPEQKQVRAAVSAGLDNIPVVGPTKSALQMITGMDLITDAPVSRMGELGGAMLGMVGGKGLLKLARKRQNTPPKKSAPKNTTSSYTGKLRGKEVTLPGIETKQIQYTKRDREEYTKLRGQFDSKSRPDFMKQMAHDPGTVDKLKKAGIPDEQILKMQQGGVPKGWQVHHKLPLDDGGTNSPSNLVLMKNDPAHMVITNTQSSLTKNIAIGETKVINFPIPRGNIYPPG